MALENWNIDVVHSTLTFSIRHLMVTKVHGVFTKWGGSFGFDEQDPAQSHVSIRIDAASVDTREAQRDTHLRSAEFFEVEKYPHIVFESTKVEPAGDRRYRVTGDLTFHGVTKPQTLEVELEGRVTHAQMGERIGFSGKTVIPRKEFGVTYNQILDTGGVGLGEKVDLVFEIEGTRAP